MTAAISLASYSEDRWLEAGGGAPLVSAVDGQTVAELPQPSDPGAMLAYARKTGSPALRSLTFQDRGKLLRSMAEALSARKEELYELSYATGATRNDSAVDIEGGIGTLFVYASKAKALPDSRILADGAREAISKGNFAGQHILTPLTGAAVHINAYNFPVWGMLEKLGPALLAGMPAIVKPASVGAYLSEAAFRILIDAGVVPPGVLQLILGSPGNLVDSLDGQDVLAFTGSAETASKLKSNPVLAQKAVRITAEQDSLNASVLGPDASAGTPEFDLFVKEVVREMTQKAGQKCTAIRRALVPASQIDAVQDAISGRLAGVRIGNPRSNEVRMGALAGLQQREDVRSKIETLLSEARLVSGGDLGDLVEADAATGAFIAPHLLRCDDPLNARAVHSVEAFGPVATLMPYSDLDEAAHIARAGEGSLVCSLFSHDRTAAIDFVGNVAASHGRILVVDRDSGGDSTGHGAALPHLVHGGPGRAGGGEELGGYFGMKHYMQRTAVQAAPDFLDTVTLANEQGR